MTLEENSQPHDFLQSYVVVMAKIILVVGFAIFAFSAFAFSAAVIFGPELPDFAQGFFFVLYSLFPFILIFGFLGFLLAFVAPAIIYIMRFSNPQLEEKKHVKFVAFVLLFFGTVFVLTFFMPYNLV